MRVGDVAKRLEGYENKSEGELNDLISKAEKNWVFGREGRNARSFVNGEFEGDSKKALLFLKTHGNDPEIADMDFNQFVESGKAKEFVALKRPVPNTPDVTIDPNVSETKSGAEVAEAGQTPETIPSSPKSGARRFDFLGGKLQVEIGEDGRLLMNGNHIQGICAAIRTVIDAVSCSVSNAKPSLLERMSAALPDMGIQLPQAATSQENTNADMGKNIQRQITPLNMP